LLLSTAITSAQSEAFISDLSGCCVCGGRRSAVEMSFTSNWWIAGKGTSLSRCV